MRDEQPQPYNLRKFSAELRQGSRREPGHVAGPAGYRLQALLGAQSSAALEGQGVQGTVMELLSSSSTS